MSMFEPACDGYYYALDAQGQIVLTEAPAPSSSNLHTITVSTPAGTGTLYLPNDPRPSESD